MDVREKLVELLGRCAVEESITIEPVAENRLVDFLANHGVTVQECGQWIYEFNLAGSNFYRCSVCDRQEALLEKEYIYEYCPFCHCGAKMIPQTPKGE